MESMAEDEDEVDGGEGNDDKEEEAAAEEKAEEAPVVEKPTEEASEVIDEDEDSSANIDSMDYADAYDEEVEGGEDEEEQGETATMDDADTTTPGATATAESTTSTSFADSTGVQSSGKTPPKIPLVSEITPAMKDILIKKLKYRPKEVQSMRPEIAAVVVAKELQRPQEGLPAHWLVADAAAPKKGSLGGRAKSILLSVLAILVAVVGGKALSNSGGYEFVWDAAAAGRSSAATTPPADSTTSKYEPPPPPAEPEPAAEPDEPEEELFAATAPTESVEPEHSLRPGQQPPTEPVDETALDKFLTKVEKGLGRVFGR